MAARFLVQKIRGGDLLQDEIASLQPEAAASAANMQFCSWSNFSRNAIEHILR